MCLGCGVKNGSKSSQGFLEIQRIPFSNAPNDIFQIANANSKGNGCGPRGALAVHLARGARSGPSDSPPSSTVNTSFSAVQSALQLHINVQAYIVLAPVIYTQIRVLTAVNIGPLLYTMQRGGGIGSACAGAVLGTALGQPVSSPSIQSILQRCCGIQRPESAFKNLKNRFSQASSSQMSNLLKNLHNRFSF